MKDFKSAAKVIGFHGKIALKGFLRMLFGAGTTCLMAFAVYGYLTVSSESGWAAVCDFVAATAMLTVALICMYVQGGSGKKTKGGSRR